MSMSILLHVCCGPCAIIPVQYLREQGYAVTAYFANPNIHPLSEYLRRREAMQALSKHFDLPVIWDDATWDLEKWLGAVQHGPRMPQRCAYCYHSRLHLCAAKAQELGFANFSSSLLYSRYQNHERIVRSAENAAQKYGVNFYYHDFRQGWQEGIDTSKALGLYRQAYCGCIYSEAERYAKKLQKLVKENFEKNI